MTILAVDDLTVSFRRAGAWSTVVDGVAFRVDAGETLAIVGESGSGKSVTALATMRLLPERTARVTGSVLLEGRDLLALPETEMERVRGRDMAMIFQEPMTSLNPVLTVGRQIAEALRRHEGLDKAAARARTVALLDRVRIPSASNRFDEYPHQLSGGMIQRVMIAMALACRPRLLIADEPTTALDVTVQAGILDLVRRLRDRHGSAVVFITHDMGVVSELADRVMVMYAGRIVEKGARSELFGDPLHPYTRALMGSIPPLTGERPRRLPAIPGSPPSLLRLPQGCSFAPRCPVRFEACEARPALPAGARAAACFRVEEFQS